MKLKMLKSVPGSRDGGSTETFAEGTVYSFDESLPREMELVGTLKSMGAAEEISDAAAEAHAKASAEAAVKAKETAREERKSARATRKEEKAAKKAAKEASEAEKDAEKPAVEGSADENPPAES